MPDHRLPTQLTTYGSSRSYSRSSCLLLLLSKRPAITRRSTPHSVLKAAGRDRPPQTRPSRRLPGSACPPVRPARSSAAHRSPRPSTTVRASPHHVHVHVLQHDGPNRLGLWCNAAPRASNGPNHLGVVSAPCSHLHRREDRRALAVRPVLAGTAVFSHAGRYRAIYLSAQHRSSVGIAAARLHWDCSCSRSGAVQRV